LHETDGSSKLDSMKEPTSVASVCESVFGQLPLLDSKEMKAHAKHRVNHGRENLGFGRINATEEHGPRGDHRAIRCSFRHER